MTPIWVVEQSFDDAYLIQSLRISGNDVLRVNLDSFDIYHHYLEKQERPVIVRGSIKFIKKFKSLKCIPGVYCNSKNLEVTTWASKYPKEWLLNDRFMLMTYDQLKYQHRDFGDIFIRPNSPFKTFTGMTITSNHEYELNSLGRLTSVMDDTLIVISSVKDIKEEYRVVIANNEVIAYSRYSWDANMSTVYKNECIELAKMVASHHWSPDIVFVVDIGYTTEPKIIEFNSFSSSGLYNCHKRNIVRVVNSVAQKEFDGEIFPIA